MRWPFRSSKAVRPTRRRRRRSARRIIAQFTRGLLAALTGRLTKDWAKANEGIGETITGSLAIVRNRARAAQFNRPYFARYLQMLRDNVPGPAGFAFQAHITDPDGTVDDAANNGIEAAKEWSRAENCDVTGRQSFASLQRSLITFWGTDGEILIHFVRGPQFGKFGFALDVVDPSLLDAGYKEDLGDGRFIQHAIEFDRWGRPVGYWITQADGRKVRYPADEILHAFIVDRVGQKRGIPMIAPALYRLHMLEETEDGGITKVRVAANTVGVVTANDPEGGPVDGEDDDGPTVSLEAGTVLRLNEGETFSGFDPRFPDGAFVPFMKHLLQGIASSVGMSYPNLSGNLEGVSYSSIRQGELSEREMWKGLQRWFTDAVLMPIYDEWLRILLLNAVPVVNGKPLKVERLQKYRNVSFRGRRWSWVDPLKEIQAHKIAVEIGEDTLSAGIREHGRDPDEVWDERAREIARMEEKGVPSLMGGATSVVGDGQGGGNDGAQSAGV